MKNPETLDFFECKNNVIEIPLNDFLDESCYGDVTFFADEINSALSDGAELLWIEEKEIKFFNQYKCPKCGSEWDDTWDSMVDDECGECGCKNISPYKSEEI
jgi:DNA-directed RNA polymerase subunit RPC12/RpoP